MAIYVHIWTYVFIYGHVCSYLDSIFHRCARHPPADPPARPVARSLNGGIITLVTPSTRGLGVRRVSRRQT